MSELTINPVAPEKVVMDYDMYFSSGLVVPITIDKEAGDSIVFDPDTITVIRVPKPSQLDDTEILEGETTVITRSKVDFYQFRERRVKQLTPEEKFQLHESFVKAPKTVQ